MTTYIRTPAPYNHEQSLQMNRLRDRGSVRCNCGAEVNLCTGDAECDDCGQLFNICGQQLNPRHMWEESYDEC